MAWLFCAVRSWNPMKVLQWWWLWWWWWERERERDYLHLSAFGVGKRIAKAIPSCLYKMGSITEKEKVLPLSEWVESLVRNILRLPFLLLLVTHWVKAPSLVSGTTGMWYISRDSMTSQARGKILSPVREVNSQKDNTWRGEGREFPWFPACMKNINT